MKIKTWNNTIKIIKKIIKAITFLVLLYTLTAFILSLLSTNPKPQSCHSKKPIYFTSNGLHLNIITSKFNLSDTLLSKLQLDESISYVSFGWGDKDFYINTPQWKDLKVKVAAQALFVKSKSAIHVTRYNYKNDHWQEIKMCVAQIKSLNEYIFSSFQQNREGKFVHIPASGYSSNDTFYEAKGSYTMFFTSNNWVNEGLKYASVKTAIWSPFDKGILYHINRQPENEIK